MIVRKSIDIVMVVSIIVFGCGKERETLQPLPQTYPEGAPREIISKKDSAEMILIPAGGFRMGTDTSEIPQLVQWAKRWSSSPKDKLADGFEAETPRHMVYLDAFYMDKYEVTNAQYVKFLNEYGKNTDAAGHELINIDSEYCLIEKSGSVYRPKENYENHPVILVTWYGAAAYAQFCDKRLPTEAEWEKAARGRLVGKRYPWGDSKPDGSNANSADKNTNFPWSDKTINDGYECTAPVGSYRPNGYSLYDMAGNVWELCADEYDSRYYSKSPKNNPKGPGVPITFKNDDFTNLTTSRVFRGGGCTYGQIILRCAYRDGFKADATYINVGFRCSHDVTP